MRVKRTAKYVLLAGVFVFAGIQLVRPARTNPVSDPSAALAAVPADVSAILDRSCRDCHSNGTRWPWYSNVAPVSWWVVDHVNHGRSHFNYSEWAKYAPQKQRTLLRESCELVRKTSMPLPSYLRMHDARMSPQDIEVLCRWTNSASLTPPD